MSHISLFDHNRKRTTTGSSSRRAQPHPYGVKPQGNMYFDVEDPNFVHRRENGFGSLACMEDASIFEMFFIFSAQELSNVALVSKAFYVFAQEEEFWKMLVVDKFGGDFTFAGTWQETYKKTSNPSFNVPHTMLQVTNFYSDYLFHIWRCTSADLSQWNCVDNIDRRSNITLEEFITDYFIPNRPVVLTDVVTKWPAFKNWSKESLIERYGDTKFFINAGVNMTLRNFFAYCDTVQEEMPMYLFDHDYGENAPTLLDDYAIPEVFHEDFFALLDKRPSFRWLLAGPPRSGATFHKDPNYTSAWNAVITGSKKWVLYPPDFTPPGVGQSEDGLEVASPVSIVEWFLNFYERPANSKKSKTTNAKRKNNEVIECILHAGEMIFVPNTWWHTVINLEESIAITQNFCNSFNLLNVVKFFEMKGKPTDALLRKIEEKYPGKYAQIKKEKEEEERKSMTYWQKVESDKEATSFSFNFGSQK